MNISVDEKCLLQWAEKLRETNVAIESIKRDDLVISYEGFTYN